MSQRSNSIDAPQGFDPLAYIENAFTDEPVEQVDDLTDIKLPSVTEFMNGESEPRLGGNLPSDTHAKREARNGQTKVRFKKRQLSAPRPRKAKKAQVAQIDPEMEQIWAALPRNIQFLSSFFDDSVTANYYRGEFRESRQSLILRLLDPELNLEEVSRLLGVCPATVRRYTNRNWLKHHRTPGGQRRFRLSGVVKFVEEHGRHPEE